MNVDKVYYAFLIKIVDAQYVLGNTYFDRGCEYRYKELGYRLVYKSGDNYIDLKTKSKYKLYSKLFTWDLKVGMLVIYDEENYELVNLRTVIDCYNIENDTQICTQKYMSKRKILKMVERGKK